MENKIKSIFNSFVESHRNLGRQKEMNNWISNICINFLYVNVSVVVVAIEIVIKKTQLNVTLTKAFYAAYHSSKI